MPQKDGAEEPGATGPAEEPDDAHRVGALRGASVHVDAARVGHVAAVVGLVAVVVVAAVLLVAGMKKNGQIDSLKANGVPVELTVTRCLALVGGTGSSPAGFECTGTYVYQGHRYTEGVPGTGNLPVGSTVHGIVASDDPALFSTPQSVASAHSSPARVVLPAVVLLAAAGVCVWVVVRRHCKVAEG
jgi:hypothetical protein